MFSFYLRGGNRVANAGADVRDRSAGRFCMVATRGVPTARGLRRMSRVSVARWTASWQGADDAAEAEQSNDCELERRMHLDKRL